MNVDWQSINLFINLRQDTQLQYHHVNFFFLGGGIKYVNYMLSVNKCVVSEKVTEIQRLWYGSAFRCILEAFWRNVGGPAGMQCQVSSNCWQCKNASAQFVVCRYCMGGGASKGALLVRKVSREGIILTSFYRNLLICLQNWLLPRGYWK